MRSEMMAFIEDPAHAITNSLVHLRLPRLVFTGDILVAQADHRLGYKMVAHADSD